MDFNIRFAERNDFTKIREFDPHSKYINPKKILGKIEQKEIIIAESHSKIMGFIKFSYFWATRPFLDFIFIKEDSRSRGLGKELLAFLENYLISEGYLYLHSSTEENSLKAIQWHKRNGFKKSGYITTLNLPLEESKEIFFCKKLSDTNNKKLKEYPLY